MTNHSKNAQSKITSRPFFVAAHAMVFSVGLIGTTGLTVAHAQSTGGSIFGSAPAGRTVDVENAGGMKRHTQVSKSGHYRLGSLPVGVYSATLVENGKEVDMHANIRLSPGGSAKVNFTCPQGSCTATFNNKSP